MMKIWRNFGALFVCCSMFEKDERNTVCRVFDIKITVLHMRVYRLAWLRGSVG